MREAAYTVQEVAEMTGFSRHTIVRMFEHETGVLVLERPEIMHKRRFRTIRIPRHVYERVITRLMVKRFVGSVDAKILVRFEYSR